MAEPFVGEIRMFAFNFAPKDWANCNGEIMDISSNQALYVLLGITFGGNGTTTFAIPDMRGRTPMHIGREGDYTYQRGNTGGLESVTLTTNEIPPHTHKFYAYNDTAISPSIGNSGSMLLAKPVQIGSGMETDIYTNDTSDLKSMSPYVCGVSGGTVSHNNMMPSIVVNFCISLKGYFPPRN